MSYYSLYIKIIVAVFLYSFTQAMELQQNYQLVFHFNEERTLKNMQKVGITFNEDKPRYFTYIPAGYMEYVSENQLWRLKKAYHDFKQGEVALAVVVNAAKVAVFNKQLWQKKENYWLSEMSLANYITQTRNNEIKKKEWQNKFPEYISLVLPWTNDLFITAESKYRKDWYQKIFRYIPICIICKNIAVAKLHYLNKESLSLCTSFPEIRIEETS